MRKVLVGLLLLSAALVAGCTSEPKGGLPADVQRQGWIVIVTYPNGTTHEYRTHPNLDLADTDDDGLDDYGEFQSGTDAEDVDTDDDGLLDGPNQCVDEGSDRYERFKDADIVENPDEPGCFFGERPFEYGDVRERLDPRDAFTSDGGGIGNGLTDGEEVRGWSVEPLGKQAYHAWSNPRIPDSDGDGLHDGFEKELGLDPKADDSDGDGVNDYKDAAPLGNLKVAIRLDEIDLENDKKLGGGADLRIDGTLAGGSKTAGPEEIPSGSSNPDMVLEFDVPDGGAPSGEEAYAAGKWVGSAVLEFYHDGSSDDPIEVRNGDNGHTLSTTVHPFAGTFEGDAAGGTSSGPDASVTLSLDARTVEVT